MQEKIYISNALWVRETDDNFYLFANRSFHSEALVHRRLQSLGHCAVYNFERSGNRQMFVYSRDDFRSNGRHSRGSTSDLDNFTENLIDVLQENGGLMVLDPHVERLENRAGPFSKNEALVLGR